MFEYNVLTSSDIRFANNHEKLLILVINAMNQQIPHFTLNENMSIILWYTKRSLRCEKFLGRASCNAFARNVSSMSLCWHINILLLYRDVCFTGKYITREIHTKPHPGLEWRIFHIVTSKDIDFISHFIIQGRVVRRPVNAKPRLKRPNRRNKFVLRLNSVSRSSISTIQELN